MELLLSKRRRFIIKSDFDTYRVKMETQIKEYRAKLVQLEARAEKAQADVKLKASRDMEEARRKLKVLQGKWESLKESSEHSFEEIKMGFENAWKEIKESLDKVSSNFKDT